MMMSTSPSAYSFPVVRIELRPRAADTVEVKAFVLADEHFHVFELDHHGLAQLLEVLGPDDVDAVRSLVLAVFPTGG